ncbi:hypothetical protein HYK36_004299 [Salmonella enterica]|nr:hypothetical protein [Salmonella enterica]
MNTTFHDFIIGQIANAESEQATKLAFAIREAIKTFKENGGNNHNSFSVDAQYNDGEFNAQCTFSENISMTVMYYEGTDNNTVQSLFNLQNDEELCRMAGLMLTEGWVLGFKG